MLNISFYLSFVKHFMLFISDVVIVLCPLFIFNTKLKHKTYVTKKRLIYHDLQPIFSAIN